MASDVAALIDRADKPDSELRAAARRSSCEESLYGTGTPYRPEFDVFTAPANILDSATEVTSGDNALKERTPSIMQISLQNFSHILLLCLSDPM